MKTPLFAALLAGAATFAAASTSQPPAAMPTRENSAPVVLELFTSQGCSSCPPADRLAERLARDPGLVVILRPVTYWDRLGWKDTLGREENTALQRAYAAKSRIGGGVYTPQIIVDGGDGAIGSDEPEVRKLVGTARTRAKPQLALVPARGGGFAAGLAGTAERAAEVVLVGLDSREVVGIGRGENSGKSVTYVNIYKGERALGDWMGGTRSYAIPDPRGTIAGADRYAVLVRERGGGRILAGRML